MHHLSLQDGHARGNQGTRGERFELRDRIQGREIKKKSNPNPSWMYVRDFHVMASTRLRKNKVSIQRRRDSSRLMHACLRDNGMAWRSWFSARHSAGLRRRKFLASASNCSSSCRASSSSQPRLRRHRHRRRRFGPCGQLGSGLGKRGGRSR